MSSPAYKRPESVLVVLHDGQGRALMLERVSPPGFWQSVTGSLEEGEAPFATALREVAEETGILLAPEELKDWHTKNEYEIYEHWRHRYAPGVTRNTEHVFSACISAASPVRLSEHEHRAHRWLPLTEAANLAFSPSNREALLRLAAETEGRLPEKLTAPPL